AASCCTCCPQAFIASVITGYWPMPGAKKTSTPRANYCTCRRQYQHTNPNSMPRIDPHRPPSFAVTAAPPCSSSRPSLALNTSAPDHSGRHHHEIEQLNQKYFVGASSKNTDANTRCKIPRNARPSLQ